MVVVDLTDDDYELARRWDEQQGILKGSITKGVGNLVGALGEIAALRVYGGTIQRDRATVEKNFDILMKSGITVDVKSKTSKVDYDPEPNWTATVVAQGTPQRCDYYIFTRVNPTLKRCWVMGHMSNVEFHKQAFYLATGQYEPGTRFKCRRSCWNMYYKDIEQISAVGEVL
jgi:hypothetical protein